MKTLRSPFLLGTCVAALLLTGCSGATDTLEGLLDSDEIDEVETTEEVETDNGDSGNDDGSDNEANEDADEQESDRANVDIAERSLGTSVFYGGLELEFVAMTVTDLDAQSDSAISQGVQLEFEVNAHNSTEQTAHPSMPIALRWDEPGTGNVVELHGLTEFRQVPPGASASGTVEVTIPPADLDVYDDDSARLIVGASNRATAQVPVGANAELITRASVDQPQLEGTTLEAGPVTITIDGGEVLWHQGGNQVAEGEPLFELYFSVTNDGDHQSCFPRGEGTTLTLKDADGFGYGDLRVGERCVSAGSTIDNITGFVIDGDWAGDYTLELQEVQVHADVFEGETSLTLVDGQN